VIYVAKKEEEKKPAKPYELAGKLFPPKPKEEKKEEK